MKKISMSSLFAAIMLTTGSAFAGGGALLGGSGGGTEVGTMYGGVSAGQATTNCMMNDGKLVDGDKDCRNPGWKIYGGYKVTDILSVEGGYYNLGSSDESLKGTVVQGDYKVTDPVAKGEASGLGIAAVASLPIVDNFEVFGKAGAMKWNSKATVKANVEQVSTGRSGAVTSISETDGTSLLLGVGASYKFNDNWGVRGEYENFKRKDVTDKDRNVGVMSVGATFSTL